MKKDIKKSVNSYNRKVQDLKGDTRRGDTFSIDLIIKLVKIIAVVFVPAAVAGSFGGEGAFVVVFLIMMFAYGGVRIGRVLGYVPEKKEKTPEEERADDVLEKVFDESIVAAVTAPVEPSATLEEFVVSNDNNKVEEQESGSESFITEKVIRSECNEKLRLADSQILFAKREISSAVVGKIGEKQLYIGTVNCHKTRSMYRSDSAHFVFFLPVSQNKTLNLALLPDNSRRYVGNSINTLFRRKTTAGELRTLGSENFQKLFRLYCDDRSDAQAFVDKYESIILETRQKLGDSLYLSINYDSIWGFWISSSSMQIIPEFDGTEINQSEISGTREALVSAVNDVYDLVVAL